MRPKVSIVTPSLNSGRFLNETIQSVLNQDYARIEYIIADGGSTDSTLEIIDRYRGQLRLVSREDTGQANAVNQAFRDTTGDIFTFLNADDVLLPGAVSAVVNAFTANPEVGVVYGNADWIDESGQNIAPYPVEDYSFERFQHTCFICQPAAFIRRDVFRKTGGLDESLDFALDYDLWIRIGRRNTFERIPQKIACSRMHKTNKTLGRRPESFKEAIEVVLRHFGHAPRAMVYGYCHALISRTDLFFEPSRWSFLAALLSVPVSAAFNWRTVLRARPRGRED